MKKLISVLIAAIVIVSCTKESAREMEVPSYVGVYHSTDSDTSYITHMEGSRVSIKWAVIPAFHPRIVFDSVYVGQDLTFTVNQFVEHDGEIKKAIGTGSFVGNTINYHFVLDGNGHIYFDGVKQQ